MTQGTLQRGAAQQPFMGVTRTAQGEEGQDGSGSPRLACFALTMMWNVRPPNVDSPNEITPWRCGGRAASAAVKSHVAYRMATASLKAHVSRAESQRPARHRTSCSTPDVASVSRRHAATRNTSFTHRPASCLDTICQSDAQHTLNGISHHLRGDARPRVATACVVTHGHPWGFHWTRVRASSGEMPHRVLSFACSASPVTTRMLHSWLRFTSLEAHQNYRWASVPPSSICGKSG